MTNANTQNDYGTSSNFNLNKNTMATYAYTCMYHIYVYYDYYAYHRHYYAVSMFMCGDHKSPDNEEPPGPDAQQLVLSHVWYP